MPRAAKISTGDKMIIDAEHENMRLDVFLAEVTEGLSRSYIQQLARSGRVSVNGSPAKASHRLKAGEEVICDIPEPEPVDIVPEDIPLDIVYEDDDVLLVNKPSGMVVHPAPGHPSGTLVNAVMFHCRGHLSGINGAVRPGIVHRIDRDTSGLIIVCKNDDAHRSLAAQLKDHSITRVYEAVVHGILKDDEMTVDAPLGRHPKDRLKMAVVPDGRRAVTHVRLLEPFRKYSHVECRLETGRTHQIRVHMAHIGHPVLGDPVYGPAKTPASFGGQVLHAGVFGFVHPRSLF